MLADYFDCLLYLWLVKQWDKNYRPSRLKGRQRAMYTEYTRTSRKAGFMKNQLLTERERTIEFARDSTIKTALNP